MFGIAAIVALAVALILQVAGIGKGDILTAGTFVIIGLLCLAVHVTVGWWPKRGA